MANPKYNGHPKYNKNATKQELYEKQYISKVEEFRRHVRIHKKIRVNYKKNDDLFADLIKVLRQYYKLPNKDFSKINSELMINKYSYTILKYEKNKMIEFEALSKGQLYNISYVIKKGIFGYKVHYYDFSIAQKTLWGLLANLAKYYYKKSVRKNARLIQKTLKKLKKARYN